MLPLTTLLPHLHCSWTDFKLFCPASDFSCFQGLFSCTEASSVLLHNFCVYHIDPPGHEVSFQARPRVARFALFGMSRKHLYSMLCSFLQPGACHSGSDYPALSVDDLTGQVAEVLDYFGYTRHVSLLSPAEVMLVAGQLITVSTFTWIFAACEKSSAWV